MKYLNYLTYFNDPIIKFFKVLHKVADKLNAVFEIR